MYRASSAESPRARRRALIVALMLWSKSTTVSFAHNLLLISSRVSILPSRSTSIRKTRNTCSLRRTLPLRSGASIDRSSPVLRSSSKAPNRTRPEERVYMGRAHKIQNKKLYQCKRELSKQGVLGCPVNFLKRNIPAATHRGSHH